jgi:hypothetical protein
MNLSWYICKDRQEDTQKNVRSQDLSTTSFLNKYVLGARGVSQAVEFLPSKEEVMSSNPCTAKINQSICWNRSMEYLNV